MYKHSIKLTWFKWKKKYIGKIVVLNITKRKVFLLMDAIKHSLKYI